jgi:hypothetical protein
MKILLCLIAFLISITGHAYGEGYENYDDIVDRLSADTDGLYKPRKGFRRNYTRAHAGIGLSQTFYQSSSSDGDRNGLRHGGMMLAFGVDLLTPRWAVEGAYHNFGRSEGETTRYQLKEVALKMFYKPNVYKSWFLRLGGGFSSRFLNITTFQDNRKQRHETPSMLITVGADTLLTSAVSFGVDLNIKNSLIEDTIDRRSVDVSLRIDTHF